MNWKKIGIGVLICLIAISFVATQASAYIRWNYNGDAAADYALSNAYNVPGSWYFSWRGGDCTNFVSHSLKAGGWRMTSQWYFYSIWNYGNKWTVANDFGRYIASSRRGYKVSLDSNLYSSGIRRGDVIQIDYERDGRYDHTLIVTGIEGNNIRVTAHTNTRYNEPLRYIREDIWADYPNARFIGYHLRSVVYSEHWA